MARVDTDAKEDGALLGAEVGSNTLLLEIVAVSPELIESRTDDTEDAGSFKVAAKDNAVSAMLGIINADSKDSSSGFAVIEERPDTQWPSDSTDGS